MRASSAVPAPGQDPRAIASDCRAAQKIGGGKGICQRPRCQAKLAAGGACGADHQIIIVDQLLVEPEDGIALEFTDRLMTENDPENPPLISYYHGP